MIRHVLTAACAASLTALALAGTASARTAERPCQNAAGGEFAANGEQIDNLPNEVAYERYGHYKRCGHLRGVPSSRTESLSVECRPGFKLAGTSQHQHNANTAHWDFYALNGEWVTWTGAGHFRVDAAGWATGYTAALHNFSTAEHTRWWVMMFATCDRIHDYKF